VVELGIFILNLYLNKLEDGSYYIYNNKEVCENGKLIAPEWLAIYFDSQEKIFKIC
jgi:hypothetical protein